MDTKSKNSILWAMVLVAFGVAVFFGGTGWAIVLLPLAVLIWFAARPTVRGGQH